jgi:hypothetical protein
MGGEVSIVEVGAETQEPGWVCSPSRLGGMKAHLDIGLRAARGVWRVGVLGVWARQGGAREEEVRVRPAQELGLQLE